MQSITRRDIVKAGGAVATSSIAANFLLKSASDPALAATGFTTEDVDVTSNDGDLSTLTIAPEVTVDWSGWDSQVHEIEVTWYVMTGSTSETTVGNTPFSRDVSSPAKSGSVTHTQSTINLLSNNGGALSASTFDAGSDGTTTTTDVELSMDCTLKDGSSNTIVSQTDLLGPQTFSVSVTNASSTVSASSTANTDGS